MRHKRWQALVMIAFGWVLWGEVSWIWDYPNHDKNNVEWKHYEAFETKAECSALIKRLMKKIKMDDRYTIIKNTVIKEKKMANLERESVFHCLPSDFDPRPR
jgi:hypothetical protein